MLRSAAATIDLDAGTIAAGHLAVDLDADELRAASLNMVEGIVPRRGRDT